MMRDYELADIDMFWNKIKVSYSRVLVWQLRPLSYTPTSSIEEACMAAAKGDIGSLRKLVKGGLNVNTNLVKYVGEDAVIHTKPLGHAIRYLQVEAVNYLIYDAKAFPELPVGAVYAKRIVERVTPLGMLTIDKNNTPYSETLEEWSKKDEMLDIVLKNGASIVADCSTASVLFDITGPLPRAQKILAKTLHELHNPQMHVDICAFKGAQIAAVRLAAHMKDWRALDDLQRMGANFNDMASTDYPMEGTKMYEAPLARVVMGFDEDYLREFVGRYGARLNDKIAVTKQHGATYSVTSMEYALCSKHTHSSDIVQALLELGASVPEELDQLEPFANPMNLMVVNDWLRDGVDDALTAGSGYVFDDD